MGNNASQHAEAEQQWAHSFPRTQQKFSQNLKVLPELNAAIQPKLRPTNNGEILYNGGTISGRHQQNNLSLPRKDGPSPKGVYRSSSISSRHPDENIQTNESPRIERYQKPIPNRTQNLPNGRHKHIRQYSHQRETQMKRFGSVPDLRETNIINQNQNHKDNREQINKGRKKYKAPPPPGISMMSNEISQDGWEITSNGENSDTPARKRLFKTRAEMKKSQSSLNQKHNIDSTAYNSNNDDSRKSTPKLSNHLGYNENKKSMGDLPKRTIPEKGMLGYRTPLAEMQRSKSLPEFQAELHAATQRLRITKYGNDKPNDSKNINKTNVSNNRMKETSNNSSKLKTLNRKDNSNQKLKTLDCSIAKKEQMRYKLKQMENNNKTKVVSQDKNLSKPGNINKKFNSEINKVNKKQETNIPPLLKETPIVNTRKISDTKEQPTKTFYFGMDTCNQNNTFNSNIIDNFASSFQTQNCIVQSQNYSGSDLSSEIENEEGQITNGIALHLRPILPKKQLEIPRFSPAAAWKLLSALEANPAPSTVSDEGPVFIEDRIEKCSRQPPLMSLLTTGPRSNHDKSGDSGISGDAGPPAFEDNAEPQLSTNPNIQISTSNYPHNMSWTPQQDLEGEEDSSSDEDMNNNSTRMCNMKPSMPTKFSVRSHVFSLSLPRDNHLAAFMEEKARLSSPPAYTNLQKLKRSVSGVLGNLNTKTKENNSQLNLTQVQSDNWFLSRSAPNSLNNGFNSLEIHLSKCNTQKVSVDIIDDEEEEEEEEEKPNDDEDATPFIPMNIKTSVNSNSRRVMYLPEYDDKIEKNTTGSEKITNTLSQEIIHSNGDTSEEFKSSYKTKMSKSCENITLTATDRRSPFEPEDLQDPPPVEEYKLKGRKSKRFTFQSTVRQIERKRLAEKLSREAERKEQQRLSELEAMQRVEEEFQRKRAKEKASIRQQLRLFSMDDTTWNNSSNNWDNKNNIPVRPEPDGAVSTPASSPTLDDSTKYNKSNSNDYNNKNNSKSSSNGNKINENRTNYNKNTSYQISSSSDEGKVKAQATQVLSEYRQLQREYKEYRGSSRWDNGDTNNNHNEVRQTTVHPKVICNMPRAHQSSNNDGAPHSTNYRRNFAHGIIVPSKSSGSTYSEDSQSNGRMHSPGISQNRRTQQGVITQRYFITGICD